MLMVKAQKKITKKNISQLRNSSFLKAKLKNKKKKRKAFIYFFFQF